MYAICVEWKNQNVLVALNQKKLPALAAVVTVQNVLTKESTSAKGQNVNPVNRRQNKNPVTYVTGFLFCYLPNFF